jgi:predicted transcriptional regulator
MANDKTLKQMMRRLSANELNVMNALWELKEAGSKELLQKLPNAPALTTLLTYLSRLEAKGYVERTSGQRGYVFRPAVPRATVVGRLLDELLKQFDGRLSTLVSHFAGTRNISAQERKRLRSVLDQLEDGK